MFVVLEPSKGLVFLVLENERYVADYLFFFFDLLLSENDLLNRIPIWVVHTWHAIL